MTAIRKITDSTVRLRHFPYPRAACQTLLGLSQASELAMRTIIRQYPCLAHSSQRSRFICPRLVRPFTSLHHHIDAKTRSASVAERSSWRLQKRSQHSTAGGASTSESGLGTAKRLPEYSLNGKVLLVSGGARGLGLTQAEALLEAGATGSL